jgi:hypothetical protein
LADCTQVNKVFRGSQARSQVEPLHKETTTIVFQPFLRTAAPRVLQQPHPQQEQKGQTSVLWVNNGGPCRSEHVIAPPLRLILVIERTFHMSLKTYIPSGSRNQSDILRDEFAGSRFLKLKEKKKENKEKEEENKKKTRKKKKRKEKKEEK